MTNHRARIRALITIAAVAVGATRSEAQRMESNSKWSLCGAGKFDFTAGGQSIGSETFDVTCTPDKRYSATGRTQLAAAGMDLTSKLELGSDLLPVSTSAKGTVQGQPFDQSATYTNGTAALTTNGQTQSVRYTPNASWSRGNIFYANMFVVARYDETKGGAQQFPVFPSLTVTIERRDGVGMAAPDGQSGDFDHFVMRIATQELHLWRDAAGKLAALTVPAQRFVAIRPESAKWASVLLDYKPGSKSAPPSPSAPPSGAIDYSAPANAPFSAQEVTIPVSSYALAGTLLEPKNAKRPFPAVVMITGSGLQTRDSRLALPGLEGYAPFRQIAERLAASGVAVLRVDDRGIGGSTGRETLQSATTTSLAEDTRAQIAWLRQRSEVDGHRIIVIGHSEGASIASMIASTDPTVYAVVMMAGVAKRGADVSFEQQEDMLRSDTTMTEATRATMREKQKEAVKTILEGGDLPGQPVIAWTREYMAYDPLPAVRKVKQPLLILQGERDRQVYQEHATLLANAARSAGNSRVTVKVFPTLNHLFLPSKTGSFSEYGHLETTAVPNDVLDTLATWIAALK
ncbi:MAG TPA: alpha/beta fold hydrolase [Gemmatimonadaceae bacterium]|nr:alpha/beta fold hydrolase [Gemmatimonadaceae bacterium]